ncbi:MAG: carbohydrate kinase family protein [Candidatus Acidiferrales bacterium]|jgi:sugar/nucleoside kinase (ribokinase family)
MPLDVCVVGEINPDLILYGVPAQLKPEEESLVKGFRLTLGSSSAIFAHNLAVLGTSVGMVSKIGADALGKMAFDWLANAGVDLARVRVASNGPATGLTVILAQPEHRFILTYPGTMFEFSHADLDLDYIFAARHLHLSSYFLHRALRPRIADLFREAKARGLSTSLDTNDDPEGKWGDDLLDVLPFVDIFFPNEREAKKVAGTEDLQQAVDRLAQLCRFVVVKLGMRGAVARKGSEEWRRTGLRVASMDPVGAGDSFDAGFIHRYLQGGTPQQCLDYADVAGAFSTTCEGGTEAFKDRNKLDSFFRQHLTSR